MCTAHLETVHASVATIRSRSHGGSSNEQVRTGLQWWQPDVTHRGQGLWWGQGVPGQMSGEGGIMARGTCTVRSNASWVMVTWGLPQTEWQIDYHRHLWKHHLPAILLTGGNKIIVRKYYGLIKLKNIDDKIPALRSVLSKEVPVHRIFHVWLQ